MQWLNDAVKALIKGHGILDVLIIVYAVAAANGRRATLMQQKEERDL